MSKPMARFEDWSYANRWRMRWLPSFVDVWIGRRYYRKYMADERRRVDAAWACCGVMTCSGKPEYQLRVVSEHGNGMVMAVCSQCYQASVNTERYHREPNLDWLFREGQYRRG